MNPANERLNKTGHPMPRRSRRSNSSSPAPTSPVAASRESVSPLSPRRSYAIGGALALGALLWVVAGNDMPALRWVVVLAVVAVSLVPPINRLLSTWLNRLRRPSPASAEWIGIVVGVIAIVYLTGTAILQDRPLAPRMFDECSYAIGAQILSHGKLWLPQHPLADFFDTFFIVTKPVYGSIYFPGTALALAPAVWFGWASWIMPVVLSGIAVALIYRIIFILTSDGVAGIVAALWMVSLMPFRALSVMTMSQIVMLLLGVMIIWTWLHWRTARPGWPLRRWTLALGGLCGWAAITRPVDALAFALPIGVAIALSLRKKPLRDGLLTALLLILGAAPFLSLQIIHNLGLTGHPLRTAYTAYLQREQPGAQFGIRRYESSWKPATDSPQLRAYYNWCRPYLQQHQPHNFLRPWLTSQQMSGNRMQPAHLLTLVDSTLPGRALLLFLPAGMIALTGERRRWPLAATLPLFLLLYVFNPFFLPHYCIVVTPAVILLTLLGVDAIANVARRETMRVAMTMFVIAIALTSLWEVRWFLSFDGRPPRDGFQESAPQSFVHGAIGLLAKPPAVVLFGPPPDLWTEMVYNVDVAWPDDAPIIHARDLGPRNVEIIEYYGVRQPDRTFYRFDWRRGSLVRLGEAGALRERLRNGTPLESLMTGK